MSQTCLPFVVSWALVWSTAQASADHWVAWAADGIRLGPPPGNGWVEVPPNQWVDKGFLQAENLSYQQYDWWHPGAKYFTLGSDGSPLEVWAPDHAAANLLLAAFRAMPPLNGAARTINVTVAGWEDVANAPVCSGSDPCPHAILLGTTQVAKRAALGNLQPLNGFFSQYTEKYKRELTQDFPRFLLYDLSFDSQWVAVPFTTDIKLIGFNSTKFDEIGQMWPPPYGLSQTEWTWERMGQVACELAKQFGDGQGMHMASGFDEEFKLMMLAAQSKGLQLYSKEPDGSRTCALIGDRLADVLEQFWMPLVRDGCASNGEGGGYWSNMWTEEWNTTLRSLDVSNLPDAAFFSNYASSDIEGAGMFMLNSLPATLSDDIRMASMPGSFTFLGGIVVVIPKPASSETSPEDEARINEGWEIVDWLLNPNEPWLTMAALARAVIPPMESLLDTFPWTEPHWSIMKEEVRRAVPPQYPLGSFSEMGDLEAAKPMRLALIRAAYAGISAVDAIGEACSVVDNVIRRCDVDNWETDAKCLNENGTAGCNTGQRYMPADIFTCAPCDPGYSQPEMTVSLSCVPCSPGNFAGQPGSRQCETCTAGTFGASTAMTACADCPPGQASSKDGMSECTTCALGRYQDEYRQEACKSCKDTETTLTSGASSPEQCVCRDNFYRSSEGNCIPCLERGQNCSWGEYSQADWVLAMNQTAPFASASYFLGEENAEDIYFCRSEDACPGGPVATCGDHMTGINCGACEKNFERISLDECRECTSGIWRYALFVACAPLIVLVIYEFWNRDLVFSTESNLLDETSDCGVLLVIFLESVSLFDNFLVDKPPVIQSLADQFRPLLLDDSQLKPMCGIYDSGDFSARYLFQNMIPFFVLACFLFVYFASVCLSPMLHALAPGDVDDLKYEAGVCGFVKRRLRRAPLSLDKCVNSFVSVIDMLFIGVVNLSISLFNCQRNPNGKETLKDSPFVLCYGDEWNSMVPVAIVTFLLVPVSFFCLQLYINCIAPRMFHKTRFRARWLFMLNRFRPGCWWWDSFVLIKALLLNFATWIFSDGVSQVFWSIFVIMLYMAGLFTFRPWRHFSTNAMDILTCFCVLSILIFLSWFTDYDRQDEELKARLDSNFELFSLLFMIPPFICCAVVGIRFLEKQFKHRKRKVKLFTEGHNFRENMQAVLTTSADKWQQFLMRLTDHDRQALKDTSDVILAELFQRQPSTKLYHQRLIVSATDYLCSLDGTLNRTEARFWTGDLVMARRGGPDGDWCEAVVEGVQAGGKIYTLRWLTYGSDPVSPTSMDSPEMEDVDEADINPHVRRESFDMRPARSDKKAFPGLSMRHMELLVRLKLRLIERGKEREPKWSPRLGIPHIFDGDSRYLRLGAEACFHWTDGYLDLDAFEVGYHALFPEELSQATQLFNLIRINGKDTVTMDDFLVVLKYYDKIGLSRRSLSRMSMSFGAGSEDLRSPRSRRASEPGLRLSASVASFGRMGSMVGKPRFCAWVSADPSTGRVIAYPQEVAELLEDAWQRGQAQVNLTSDMGVPPGAVLLSKTPVHRLEDGGYRSVHRVVLGHPQENVNLPVFGTPGRYWFARSHSETALADERRADIPADALVDLDRFEDEDEAGEKARCVIS